MKDPVTDQTLWYVRHDDGTSLIWPWSLPHEQVDGIARSVGVRVRWKASVGGAWLALEGQRSKSGDQTGSVNQSDWLAGFVSLQTVAFLCDCCMRFPRPFESPGLPSRTVMRSSLMCFGCLFATTPGLFFVNLALASLRANYLSFSFARCREGYQGIRCDQFLPKTDSILSDPSKSWPSKRHPNDCV